MRLYPQFERQCVRNLLAGTALSILPAGAFYFFVFPFTARQLGILATLGILNLAAFMPLDIWLLKWTLRPVKAALAEGASEDAARRGLVRLLDSPRLVLLRVFGPHAVSASAGLMLLVMAANQWLGLGIPPRTFGLYWLLNLTVIPIGHVIYEFTAMERATQPAAALLNARVGAVEARPFSMEQRMRVFFPLLCLGPIVIISVSVYLRARDALGEEAWTLVRDVAAIGVASFTLFLYLMWVLGRQIRHQTTTIVRTLDRLGRGEMEARAELYATSEFGQMAAHVNDMAEGLRERLRLRDLFGAYMKRFVAIMFVDVRDFTAFSQGRAPEVVVSVLNQFFEEAVEGIASNGGTVNKYLGDGLLAIFGAPMELENPCAAAVRAALDISQRVKALNGELAGRGVAALRIGIAVHGGEVVVGSIGSPKHKLEYTVIGDAVNVTSRIEGLNKRLGTEILVSESALNRAGEEWQARAGAPVAEQVKGVEEAVVVYPLRSSEGASA
jgi:class 3 adenylate cyclase